MNNLYEELQQQRELLIESKSDQIAEALKEGNIEEGFLGTILGGIAGMTAGAAVMKAVCKTLGIEKGLIYDMLTSKMVCAAAGAAIGNNIKM